MKQGRTLMMALAVTVLAALPAQAQQGGMGGGQGRGGMGNMGMARALTEQGSVEFLLGKAADLKITDAQKTSLQALATAWATTVKESREQVKTNLPAQGQGMGGGAAGGDREAMMARFQALQPHMQKLTEEDTKSVEEAMKLLNDEQKVAAKALLDARAESVRPRRPGGPGGARGAGGM